jgi:hypothetical protein
MMTHPVGELPEDQLKRYRENTGQVLRYPELAGLAGDDSSNTEILQEWSDRHNKLKDEIHRRKEEGIMPNISSPSSHYTESEYDTNDNNNQNVSNNNEKDTSTDKNQEGTSSGDIGPSSSINKRKFEKDDESSVQDTKQFKQDSRDITGDTEPFDFCSTDD